MATCIRLKVPRGISADFLREKYTITNRTCDPPVRIYLQEWKKSPEYILDNIREQLQSLEEERGYLVLVGIERGFCQFMTTLATGPLWACKELDAVMKRSNEPHMPRGCDGCNIACANKGELLAQCIARCSTQLDKEDESYLDGIQSYMDLIGSLDFNRTDKDEFDFALFDTDNSA
jgi:hypothetical protein